MIVPLNHWYKADAGLLPLQYNNLFCFSGEITA